MTTCDTSVLVAAFSTWHEHHDVARAALERCTLLGGHAAFEAMSVLTRLPEPYRVHGSQVLSYLESWFPKRSIVLSAAETDRLLRTLVEVGISGGAVYDGLVAAAAGSRSLRLLSLDRRATVTYQRLDIDFELLV